MFLVVDDIEITRPVLFYIVSRVIGRLIVMGEKIRPAFVPNEQEAVFYILRLLIGGQCRCARYIGSMDSEKKQCAGRGDTLQFCKPEVLQTLVDVRKY